MQIEREIAGNNGKKLRGEKDMEEKTLEQDGEGDTGGCKERGGNTEKEKNLFVSRTCFLHAKIMHDV